MIKINLLPQRKVKKADKGQQIFAAGFAIVVLCGLFVYLLVHRPLVDSVDSLKRQNSVLKKSNDDKKQRLKGFPEIKAKLEAATQRREAILMLSDAQAVPAHFLHELGQILSGNGAPTMTEAMTRRVDKDPNRELTPWNPRYVWVTSFSEKAGEFKLEGGARSDSDMTELAKRLQASVYFEQVIPEGGAETVDRKNGVTYYKFTISGKVVY